jgi:hypothetical protein
VITPAIEINSKKKYKLNKKKEKGVDVKESFVYDSGSNIKFLNVNQIKKKLT